MTSLIKNFTLFTIALLLIACNQSIALATPVPVHLKPTSTQTPAVPPTPTPASTSTMIPPTADPVFFRDDFDGRLGPGWTWMREVSTQWSLTAVPGSLQIDAGDGYINSENMANVLLRPAPASDFQIETKLTFYPDRDFQFAGLIVYESESNFIQVGHAYCRSETCVRGGLYMNYVQDGLFVFPNFGQPYQRGESVILRLIHKGNNYIFEMSTDNRVFYVVGEHVSAMNPLQVGLMAGQNVNGEIIPALFDYFQITSPQ